MPQLKPLAAKGFRIACFKSVRKRTVLCLIANRLFCAKAFYWITPCHSPGLGKHYEQANASIRTKLPDREFEAIRIQPATLGG